MVGYDESQQFCRIAGATVLPAYLHADVRCTLAAFHVDRRLRKRQGAGVRSLQHGAYRIERCARVFFTGNRFSSVRTLQCLALMHGALRFELPQLLAGRHGPDISHAVHPVLSAISPAKRQNGAPGFIKVQSVLRLVLPRCGLAFPWTQ
ncbi:hypothetical protein [Acidovorax sp. RAC01]|uniref:hypothetical protein n=1 Tax=Acidovorax sp. RAC01 TaxID=1842533 RepID=UPI00083E71AD|nr:hypothetical protein [Acidovorax sp. RAC01]